jgi:DNA invertase Pin-like site-specific DNA recombinase
MKLGYARVSTADQSLDVQLAALKKSGCQRIFREKILESGVAGRLLHAG